MAEYERGRGYSSLEDVSGSPNLSFDEQPQVAKVSLLERILTWRKYLILVLTPILLMPIAIAIEGTVSLESLWRLNLWSTFFKMRRQILVSAPLFQNHWYYELFFSFLNIQRELKIITYISLLWIFCGVTKFRSAERKLGNLQSYRNLRNHCFFV